MADASLLGCPPEIIGLIFGLLETRAFHSLCLVNKALHIYSEPHLYSRISWTWTFEWPSDGPGPVNTQIPPVVLFLRSIIDRPELATLVREITVTGDSLSRITHHYEGDLPCLPVDGLDLAIYGKLLCRMDLPMDDRDRWNAALRRGKVDALLTLVLSRVPNLRYLRLEENCVRRNPYIGMLLCRAVREPGPLKLFRSLSKAHVQLLSDVRNRHNFGLGVSHLAFFYLPSLEQLAVSVDNAKSGFQWPAAHPPNPSNLRNLDLGILREGNLGNVLSVIPTLQTLRWEWFYSPRMQNRWMTPLIDLDKISTDLSHVRQSLRHLTITARAEGEGWEEPVVRVTGSLAPLARFDALTSLEVPLPFLVGSISVLDSAELGLWLPRNLEKLTIADDLCFEGEFIWCSKQISQLVHSWIDSGEWKTSTPLLQCLRLSLGNVNRDHWNSSLTSQLTVLREKAGLQVEVIFSYTRDV